MSFAGFYPWLSAWASGADSIDRCHVAADNDGDVGAILHGERDRLFREPAVNLEWRVVAHNNGCGKDIVLRIGCDSLPAIVAPTIRFSDFANPVRLLPEKRVYLQAERTERVSENSSRVLVKHDADSVVHFLDRRETTALGLRPQDLASPFPAARRRRAARVHRPPMVSQTTGRRITSRLRRPRSASFEIMRVARVLSS